MKCKKCGADIPSGYVYCKVCGNEVQLVSEYSDFEEDLLSEIVKEEAGEALHKKAGKSSPLSHTDFLRKKKKNKKTHIFGNEFLWSL